MRKQQIDIVGLGDIHTGDGTVSRHDALRLIGLLQRLYLHIDHTSYCKEFRRDNSECRCDYDLVMAMAEKIVNELLGVNANES